MKTPSHIKTLAKHLNLTPQEALTQLARFRVRTQLSVTYNHRKRRWFISLPLKNARFTYLICDSTHLAEYVSGKTKLWIPGE